MRTTWYLANLAGRERDVREHFRREHRSGGRGLPGPVHERAHGLRRTSRGLAGDLGQAPEDLLSDELGSHGAEERSSYRAETGDSRDRRRNTAEHRPTHHVL